MRSFALIGFVCLTAAGCRSQATHALETRQPDPITGSAGKPVVLIFLRTDCPISKRYAPTIQALANKYSGRARFWLVFPNRGDSAEMVTAHKREFGYQIAALRDPNHVLVGRAKATITPEAALFDSRGVLRYHGRIDDWYVSFGRARPTPTKHELDEALAAVVAGRPVTKDATPAVGCYIADLK